MAIEESIKINVDTGQGAKSLSELKKEFKETQKTLEGLDTSSKEYVKTLQKLGGIKDDIGDLNDEIKAFNPEGKVKAFGNVIGGLASGFQAAQGAAALFGAEGEALQKTLIKVQAASALADGIKGIVGMGDAFKVLGNIIKANPIFLIIGVITAIGGALFALKDKISFVGDAFDAIGEAIGWVIDKGKEFLDWIGVSNFALDEMRENITKNNEAIRNSMTTRYDTEIRLAKAAGKETMQLELDKQKAIKDTTQAQIDALKRKGELDEDEKKKLLELQGMNREAILQTVEIYGRARVEREQAQAKETEHYRQELQKRVDLARKLNADLEMIQRNDLLNQQARMAEMSALQDQAMMDRFNKNVAQNQADDEQREANRLKDQADLQAKKDLHQQEFESTQQLVNATKAITDLVFAHQLRQANGNATRERAIKKKQFKVNKGFGLANATIDGIGSVMKALNNPYPLNIILAVASGVMAAANIVKIASTKFDDGGTGADAGGGGANANIGSLGSAGGGVALSPPQTGSTQLNADGTVKNANMNQPVKAYVTETDITSKQKGVNRIEERARL